MQFQRDTLRRLRAERKLSREALGIAAGLTGQAIWKIEAGLTDSPRMPTVNALADALGVESAIFYGLDANQSKKRRKRPA